MPDALRGPGPQASGGPGLPDVGVSRTRNSAYTPAASANVAASSRATRGPPYAA